MKKLLFAFAVLLIAVLVAAIAAPWLIDAGQYRTEIARHVSAATGRDVAIDGAVEFVLLPSPRVRASDVRVVSAESDAPVTISARYVELELGWASFFGRAVEITHLRAIEPEIVIAVPRDNEGWELPQLGPIGAVHIERADIQNGRIVWIEPQVAAPRTIEQIQTSIIAAPLANSLRITGTAVASAIPVEFDAVIGYALEGHPNPVSLTANIRPRLARVTLRGTYDSEGKSLHGRLQIEGGDMFAALDATGIAVNDALAGPASQPFSATGDFGWTPAGVTANDLAVQLGDVRATGAVNVTLAKTPSVDVALALTWIDFDKIARLKRRVAAVQRTGAHSNDVATARLAGQVGQRQRMPERQFDVGIDIVAEAVGLNGGIVRDLRLNAVMSRGDLVINQISALLPGGTELSGIAQIGLGADPPRIEGTITVRSDNLRGLIDWLGIDTSGVPAGRLRRFEGQARIQGTSSHLELVGLNIGFDSTRATGGIAVAAGERIGLGIDLKIDQINVDGYSALEAGPPPSGSVKSGLVLSAALLNNFDANLRLVAETVTIGGEPINGVELDATLQRGDMVLRHLEIREAADAAVEAHGKILTLAHQATADLQIVIRAKDTSRLLRLAGFTTSKAAPLSFAGRLTLQSNGDAAFDDLDLTYGGTRLMGKAKLAVTPMRRLALDLKAGRLSIDALPKLASDDGASVGIDMVISADAVTFGEHEIGAPRLEVHLDAGILTGIDFTGAFYGGAFDLTAHSEGIDRKKLNGTAMLHGIDLGPTLSALIGSDAIRGRGDLRAAFSVPTRWSADIWSGLSGAIELQSGAGAIVNLDLPLMRDMVDTKASQVDVASLLGAGLHGGETPFSTMECAAHIQGGELTIDTLRIATAVGEATGGGGVDLGRSTVNLWLDLPVAAQGIPPIRLQVGGRVDEPRIEINFAQLQSYLARRNADTPGDAQGSTTQ